jgi:hypothetical protein
VLPRAGAEEHALVVRPARRTVAMPTRICVPCRIASCHPPPPKPECTHHPVSATHRVEGALGA